MFRDFSFFYPWEILVLLIGYLASSMPRSFLGEKRISCVYGVSLGRMVRSDLSYPIYLHVSANSWRSTYITHFLGLTVLWRQGQPERREANNEGQKIRLRALRRALCQDNFAESWPFLWSGWWSVKWPADWRDHLFLPPSLPFLFSSSLRPSHPSFLFSFSFLPPYFPFFCSSLSLNTGIDLCNHHYNQVIA